MGTSAHLADVMPSRTINATVVPYCIPVATMLRSIIEVTISKSYLPEQHAVRNHWSRLVIHKCSFVGFWGGWYTTIPIISLRTVFIRNSTDSHRVVQGKNTYSRNTSINTCTLRDECAATGGPGDVDQRECVQHIRSQLRCPTYCLT